MEMTVFEGAAWVSAFLAGLLGGGHCLMMCGGFVTAFSQMPARPGIPISPANQCIQRQKGSWWLQLAVNLGRIASYTLMGIMLGLIGKWAFAWLLPIQRGLSTLAALVLILIAVAIARGGASFPWLEKAGLKLYQSLFSRFGLRLMSGGLASRFGLGLLWGLMPCGMVYFALSLALVAGGPLRGGLVMLAFGLGTLPNLLLVGVLLQRFGRFWQKRWLRISAALIIVAFALWSLNKLWLTDKMERHLKSVNQQSQVEQPAMPHHKH